jgi:predicted metal-dependent hydrolase
LIQIAAALHHHTRGNRAGARSLLEKGWRKLERFGETSGGIDLAGLRRQLQPWREFLRAPEGTAPESPPLPHIDFRR